MACFTGSESNEAISHHLGHAHQTSHSHTRDRHGGCHRGRVPNATSGAAVAARRSEDLDERAGAVADGGACDVLHAIWLSPRARGERADDSGSGRDRLGRVGTPVGDRASRLHARHDVHGGVRRDRPHRSPRRQERRRHHGHAHRVCRWIDSAEGAEGARPRRARRRAAERLAAEGQRSRPACRRQGTGDDRLWAQGDERRGECQRLVLGPRQPDLRGGDWRRHVFPLAGGPDRDTEVTVSRSVGPDPGRRGADLPEPQRVGSPRRFDPHAVLCS